MLRYKPLNSSSDHSMPPRSLSDEERISIIMGRIGSTAEHEHSVQPNDLENGFLPQIAHKLAENPDHFLHFLVTPQGLVGKLSGTAHAVELAGSVMQAYHHRLGRTPTPDELQLSLGSMPQWQQLSAQTTSGEIEVKPLPPLPSDIQNDPFEAHKNHPIIGYTDKGEPIRSPFPHSNRSIDPDMEIRDNPLRPFPPPRKNDRDI